MAAAKKIGLADHIVPSLEELHAIKNVKAIASRISAGNEEKNKANWSLMRREWYKIKFYRPSGTPLKKLREFNQALADYVSGRSVRSLQKKWRQEHKEELKGLPSYIRKQVGRTPFPYPYWAEARKVRWVWGKQFDRPKKLFSEVQQAVRLSESIPVKLSILGFDNDWIFKGYHYVAKGPYSEEQFQLLILEAFDKERRQFERLKRKFESAQASDSSTSRPRVPENVRIEVWRRDGGKCARCGSREKLEYDHIIPVAKGGGNTARNIELLCEKCNREKSDKIE